MWRCNKKLNIFIGGLALLAGLLYYLLYRPEHTIDFLIFLAQIKTLPNYNLETNLAWADSLPSFLHVFAMILLTAAILPISRFTFWFSCLLWISLDAALECAQAYSRFLLKWIPQWFDALPILNLTRDYLRSGTFDILDLIAIGLGGIAAALILLRTNQHPHYKGTIKCAT